MSGMNNTAGTALDDMAHIRQSVRDILTTRVGWRIGRRDYGSMIPELIDHPGNAANLLRLMSATVSAIARWEPRIRITRVVIDLDVAGKVVVAMEAVRIDGPRSGESVSMAVKVT